MIFLANNTVSFGNLLFNLTMGRLLTPEDYGNLGAIMSLLVLLGTPLSIYSLMIVKAVSSAFGKGELGKIISMYHLLTRKSFLLGIVIVLFIIALSQQLSIYFHLSDNIPVIVLSLFFLYSFPSTLNRSILQGIMKFHLTAINSFLEIFLKLVISTILVLGNFRLLGALLGPFIGGFASYILTYFELNAILEKDIITDNKTYLTHSFWETAAPIFFATLTLSLFFNADMILVRHFFDGTNAGQYLALSTVGRIIFYMAGPVITVMFPIISSRAGSGREYILHLIISLMISLAISATIIFIYYIFPRLLLNILYGGKYDGVSQHLVLFSFYMAIYSINSILTYFLLSISFYRPLYFLFAVSMFQTIFIYLFHNSLSDIIWINILTSFIYMILAVYFIWKKEKNIIINSFQKIISTVSYVRFP